MLNPLGGVLLLDQLPGQLEGGKERLLFLGGGVEPVGHVASGHYQRVTLRDREAVPESQNERVGVEDALEVRMAEGTAFGAHAGPRLGRVVI